MIVKTRTMGWPVSAVIRFALSRDLRGIGGVLTRKWFVFIVCLWASQASAQGTYTATSCSQAAVSAAITAEQAHPVDGDIISIPAGTCTWSAGINTTFSNSVTIKGAGAVSSTAGGASTTGTDQTVITNHTSSPSFNILTSAGKSFRFTGIALIEDASTGPITPGDLTVNGRSTSVRVDHVHIHITGSKGIGVEDSVIGVADHVYIDTALDVTNDFAFENGALWNGETDGFGDNSWVDTDHFGTNQFFYVEDTRFIGGWVSDCTIGGRWVLRYSTVVNNHGMANHGTHTQYRGCRSAEVYQNTFTFAFPPRSSGGFQHFNSGAALVWGNNSTGYNNVVDTGIVRQSNVTYDEPAPPNGWGYCGNAQTGVTSAWDQNTTNNGYPCLDQPTRGAGDLLSGNFPPNGPGICNLTLNPACNILTGHWPRQALTPLYVWANNSDSIIVGEGTGILADNRDYYQQFGTFGEPGSFNGTKGIGQGALSARPSTCTAGPGGNTPGVGYWATDTNTLYVCNPTNTWTIYYTPYTYPHPLTQSSGTTVAPPTNLAVIVN